MEAHPELPLSRMESLAEVMSLGFMMGTSIVFPNIKYKGPFYHFVVICVFSTSFLVYNVLQWKIVTKYLLPASVMVVMPVGVLFLQTDIPLPFFLDRIPLLAMFISLTVMGLDQYLERESVFHYILRRPPSAGRPVQPTYDLRLPRMPDIKARLDIQENSSVKALVVHMQEDIEKGLSGALSERSSDISLGSVMLESLPRSWDSVTKGFFQDGSIQGDQPVDQDNRNRISV